MAKTAPRKKKNGSQPTVSKPVPNAPIAKEPEEPALPTKRVHPLVVAFVAFHVVAITIYALPKPSDGILNGSVTPRGSDSFLKYNQQVLKESAPIYGYLYVTGFWQYWDMFAPDPAQVDLWCSAEIEYLDGTKKEVNYPRIYDLTIPQKFIYERHRKYYERVNQENNRFLWPSFGQYLAYQNANDPNNPPVKVTLKRHFQAVMRHDNPQPKEPPYSTITFYWYIVDQQKLYSDRGWKFGLH